MHHDGGRPDPEQREQGPCCRTTPSLVRAIRRLHTAQEPPPFIVSSSQTSPSFFKNQICFSVDDDGCGEENVYIDDEEAMDIAANDDDDETDGGYWSAQPSSPGAACSLTIIIPVPFTITILNFISVILTIVNV